MNALASTRCGGTPNSVRTWGAMGQRYIFKSCCNRANKAAPIEDAIQKNNTVIPMPTFVEVITSPNCPHSPRAVRMAARVVGEKKNVHFVEVSMVTHQGQEVAQAYGVSATPVIAINGRVVYVGIPTKLRLEGMIASAVREENERTNYFF